VKIEKGEAGTRVFVKCMKTNNVRKGLILMKKFNKFLCFLLVTMFFMGFALNVQQSNIYGSATTSIEMSVNQPSPWAVEDIEWAIMLGLVPQILQSNYTQPTTRSEFAALTVTFYEFMYGEITGRSTFSDTNDINVQKAAYIGVVTGVGNNMFSPNGQLTREQAAVMLSRLADAIGFPLSAQSATFSDNTAISSWAIDGVGEVQAAGIMGGVGNNMFAPQGSYTREQSIVTIVRLLDIVFEHIFIDYE